MKLIIFVISVIYVVSVISVITVISVLTVWAGKLPRICTIGYSIKVIIWATPCKNIKLKYSKICIVLKLQLFRRILNLLGKWMSPIHMAHCSNYLNIRISFQMNISYRYLAISIRLGMCHQPIKSMRTCWFYLFFVSDKCEGFSGIHLSRLQHSLFRPWCEFQFNRSTFKQVQEERHFFRLALLCDTCHCYQECLGACISESYC